MGFFQDAQGQLTPQSMVGYSQCRTHPRLYGCPRYQQNEKDSIKNEGAGVFTLYINSSDAQWQITPVSKVVSGRNF